MTTGTSACVHLRKIKRPCLSARNDVRRGLVAQGVGRLNLRQSPGRKIHTACRTTVPTRSFLCYRLAGALSSVNPSALEDYRSATRACYLTNCRSVRGLSITSPIKSQPSADELVDNQLNTQPPCVPPSNVDNENSVASEATIDSVDRESLKREYDDFRQLTRSCFLQEFSRTRGTLDLGYHYSYRCSVGPRSARRAFYAETKAPSRLLAKVLARRSIKEQFQQANLWDSMLELRILFETNDPRHRERLGALNALSASLGASEAHLRIPILDIQDDLLLTFDKDAREDLEKANSLMKSEELHSKEGTKPTLPLPRSPIKIRNSMENRNRELTNKMKKAQSSTVPSHKAIREQTMALPVRKYQEESLKMINNNTYSLCVAETGSGKSTQIPQLILEDAVSREVGASCGVLCVQPRRIAATSLAKRVAEERFEKLGNSVGYTVRFDSRPPEKAGNIHYCTTGILMNMLKNGPDSLEQLSHIILDEVHVRDSQIDLVMMMLKRAIEQRQAAGKSFPRVVLMSATVDVDLFASYFGTKSPDGTLLPAPHLTIPGRTFEVKKHYLEEVIHDITHCLPPEILSTLLQNDHDTANFLNSHFKADDQLEEEEMSPLTERENKLEEVSVASGLITATLLSLLSTTTRGSILAFVPGLQQIDVIVSQLKEAGSKLGFDFEDQDKFKIIRLHSELLAEQRELNVPVPQGCRRIIIATDIAEASLTIPDVRYVVDSGKVNQMEYDTAEQVQELAPRWISRSAALQRAGRAGRVQAGNYYFHGSSDRFSSLRSTRAPEITRSDLGELCLHVRKAIPDPSVSISDLLAQTIEPPSYDRVSSAVNYLKELQALDEQEQLTGLGHILEKLDMDPSFGKMVILGVMFRCLDPMVILAGLGRRAYMLFRRNLDRDNFNLALQSRSGFQHGEKSDHMISINAFRSFREELMNNMQQAALELASSRGISVQEVFRKAGGSPSFRKRLQVKANKLSAGFASSRYIDANYFRQAETEGQSIMKKLNEVKLLDKPPSKAPFGEFGSKSINANSDNANLVKALLIHCLSPNLAVKRAGAIEIKPGIRLHQRIKLQGKEPAILAYSRKWATQENSLGIKEVTQVRPLAACLLTHKLESEDGLLLLDSWLEFKIRSESHATEEVSKNLVQQHALLNDALHTAFEALHPKNFRVDKNHRYQKARDSLFTNLQQTMELIVNMDAPSEGPSAPKHWE